MYDKVRQVTGMKKSTATSCIEANDGTIIMEQGEILKRWEEYIAELFSDHRGTRPTVTKVGGHHILEEEVVKALNRMSTGKAAGPDRVLTEMILALEDFGIAKITQLANKFMQKVALRLRCVSPFL